MDIAGTPRFLLPGRQYETCLARRGEKVPAPLLFSREAAEALADLLLSVYPDGPVLFVGHGTDHPAGQRYADFAARLRERGGRGFLGLLRGTPDFAAAAAWIEARGARRLTLVPLMMTAGRHARQDVCGQEEGSWRSRLTRLGLEVTPAAQGIWALAAVRELAERTESTKG
ncbi:MAG: sirohydrochlorin cobaltochelatase [Oscillospiraceae bacterium]|jgi:sirohydrochlorin cobaltochelatase|nr:sirohydrochlorin cobaltochelatase [Oscillospiraceae bacterium]